MSQHFEALFLGLENVLAPAVLPPPLVFGPSGGLTIASWISLVPDPQRAFTGWKISSPSPQVDEPVPLSVAIRTCLYQYVFEILIQDHETIQSIRDQDSIDYLLSTNEFPEPPQDPKLCFLLKTASSPSLWNMPEVSYGVPYPDDNPFRYDCTFISRALLNIGVHLDVHKFSLVDKNIPSFSLDVNRHAVLKLLYEMISSDNFGNGRPARPKDCCIALVIFLRVLTSTSRRPHFLPENWCTPKLAENSARIAFRDDEWKWCFFKTQTAFEEDIQQFTPATEFALYFFSSPLFRNEAVRHFVTQRIFVSVEDQPYYIKMQVHDAVAVVRAFLLALGPDRLDSEIFEQARDYVFEPHTLFTACVLLLAHKDETKSSPVLRHLALLSPKHESWDQCLERLDTVSGDFALNVNRDDYSRRTRAFQTFVQGECVDANYGMDDVRVKQGEDDRPNNPPTNVRLPSPLWRRFLWHRGRELKNKEAASSGGGEV